MGLDRISHALADHSTIALDACILIYYLEDSPSFGQEAESVFERIVAGRNQAVMATMALLELQVGPYAKHDRELVEYYYDSLANMPNVRWLPLDMVIADRAAQLLRAEYRLKTPDAVHLATAIESEATLFVTNDRDMPRIPDIEYLMLGD